MKNVKDIFSETVSEYTYRNLEDEYLTEYPIEDFTLQDIEFQFIKDTLNYDGRNTICFYLPSKLEELSQSKIITALVNGLPFEASIIEDIVYVKYTLDETIGTLSLLIPNNNKKCYDGNFVVGTYSLVGNFEAIELGGVSHFDLTKMFGDYGILKDMDGRFAVCPNLNRKNIHRLDLSNIDIGNFTHIYVPYISTDEKRSYLSDILSLFKESIVGERFLSDVIKNNYDKIDEIKSSSFETLLLGNESTLYTESKHGLFHEYIRSFRLKDLNILYPTDNLNENNGGRFSKIIVPKISIVLENEDLHDYELYFNGKLIYNSYTLINSGSYTQIMIGLDRLYNFISLSISDMEEKIETFYDPEDVLVVVKKPKSYFRSECPIIDDYRMLGYFPRKLSECTNIKVFVDGILIDDEEYMVVDNGEFTVVSTSIDISDKSIMTCTGYTEDIEEVVTPIATKEIISDGVYMLVYKNGHLMNTIEDFRYISEKRALITNDINPDDKIKGYVIRRNDRGSVQGFGDTLISEFRDFPSINIYDIEHFDKFDTLPFTLYTLGSSFYETGIVPNFDTMDDKTYDLISAQFPEHMDKLDEVFLDTDLFGLPRDVYVTAEEKYVDMFYSDMYRGDIHSTNVYEKRLIKKYPFPKLENILFLENKYE